MPPETLYRQRGNKGRPARPGRGGRDARGDPGSDAAPGGEAVSKLAAVTIVLCLLLSCLLLAGGWRMICPAAF